MVTTMVLNPRLVVPQPDVAFQFYKQVFDATLIDRYTDDQSRVVHLGFSIAGQVLSLTQSVRDWGLLDPLALEGSPCLLHLTVEDPDLIANRFVENGGMVLIEIDDRPYGKREGRVQDPSGHLWILSKQIEALSPHDIKQRLQGS